MIPYMGGKCYLAKWIISHFPDEFENMSYAEVFGGGGWVLFKKPVSNIEVYNDADANLVNLFVQIRDNFDEFYRKAEWTLHSRQMFKDAFRMLREHENLSDLDRALYFAITKFQSFSGKSESWGYGRKSHKPRVNKWTPFLRRLNKIRDRLQHVQTECDDFQKIIERYDSDNTLFYLDPPYVEKEFYYDVGFGLDDHKRLAAILSSISGKFALSYYPHRLLDELYSDYNVIKKRATKHSAGLTRTTRMKKRPKSVEMLITNY